MPQYLVGFRQFTVKVNVKVCPAAIPDPAADAGSRQDGSLSHRYLRSCPVSR